MSNNEYSAPAAACAAGMLRLLARVHRPQSLAAISRELKCTKSLAFRVVRELEEAELVMKIGSDGYQLGLAALELGAAVALRSGHAESTREILRELAAEANATANIGVLRDFDVLFVLKQEAPEFAVTVSHVGQRLPANCSALGKMLLAQLADDEIQKRAPARLPRLTSKSNADLIKMMQEVREARDAGHAVDYESAILGRCAIAIPIRMPQLGGEVGALALTASMDDFEQRRDDLLACLIRSRAVIERGLVAREAIRDSMDQADVMEHGGN